MRDFLFPQDQVWIVGNPTQTATGDIEDGLALLVFTDEDLAATYRDKMGLSHMKATAIQGAALLAAFLNGIRKAGVTHVAIDHTPGQQAPVVSIEKAIEYAEQQDE